METRFIFSILFLALALANQFYPGFKIDTMTLVLLILAFSPWLSGMIRSLEGFGVKISISDVEKVKEETKMSGLIPKEIKKSESPIFMRIFEENPNLALASLRMEIETRLKEIARRKKLDTQKFGIGIILHELKGKGVLSQSETFAIRDILFILNQAVHGAEISLQASSQIINIGPQLLLSLDEKIKKS